MILVVGGGISGITAAVEIAEVGNKVILIEKEPFLGGNVVKMNNYFPKLCPPTCGLEINFRRIRNNSRIKVLTSTELVDYSGKAGAYKVRLKQEPQYVNTYCTSCGKCVEVCPEERLSDFDYNFSKTKAIYLPHEMAFPMKYHIDDRSCKKTSCNKCIEVCEYNAIDFDAKEMIIEEEVTSIIFATGWINYDASRIDNLNYSKLQDVVTNVEFERLIADNGPGKGKLLRPSDQKEPKEIAFVQCAGSRDENYLPYCSAVCCSASLKHALTLQVQNPGCKIKIFYIDLRVSGRNEDFLNRVKDNPNIDLIKGKVAGIEIQDDQLYVEAENILEGKKSKYYTELVVLATGIRPSKQDGKFSRTRDDFLLPEQDEGIQAVACCKKPMDVSASVKDATAAAIKAIQIENRQ